MYDSVLLATDGSGDRRAIRHALDLAEQHAATVHVLYVIDIVQSGPGIIGRTRATSTRSTLRDEGQEALRAIRTAARRRGISVVTEIREGIPTREIRAYGDEAGVDLLILSPHGRTGFDRLLQGSVTEQVLRRTDQPVLAIQKGT
ncbi:universal stress protein [Halomarina pelagica]|uniref:universal stress protein n=1 Tax=Halomarina pelagica TaxID=2961599 RepID=UPI0020C28BE6|nr:universal stress protein [Halomarina sp. BND7]